ncbi:hypothetical protein DSOUD_3245 [Desulfuromonas soudanensis]|uniref:Uncharacterized protein n=1 Tax=Desulfuromonas soudanensis TaxID=1603606 RepID=A0A0M4D3E5_9BACT|nr:hypothetical protein [Desulfuromonas soudanensis]ALC17965.1 hypothetical protein DSOUD_3245 [Desulfuromonas soudanensis]
MKNQYYADTAYDSTSPRTFASGNNLQFGMTTRKLRVMPLNTNGIHCRECLAEDDAEVIELLNEDSAEVRKQLEAAGHEAQPWQTFGNPRAVVTVVTAVVGLFIVFGGLPGLVTMILIGGVGFFEAIKGCSYLLVPAFSIYAIGKLILRYDLVKDKNNVLINRRTGMISIPQKKRGLLELPFDEFDPYLTAGTNPTGSSEFYLQLGHRYSEARVQYPPNMTEPWQVYLAWEYWQQYMDISQPLPDTPRMEPFRSRDPVTAAYDKEHNRPADYWKKTPVDQARKMKMASVKSAAAYPWGASYQQARAMGWQPSGYGEGPSTENPAPLPDMTVSQEPEVPPEDFAVVEQRGDFEVFK